MIHSLCNWKVCLLIPLTHLAHLLPLPLATTTLFFVSVSMWFFWFVFSFVFKFHIEMKVYHLSFSDLFPIASCPKFM